VVDFGEDAYHFGRDAVHKVAACSGGCRCSR
jgi:hypothetical protein